MAIPLTPRARLAAAGAAAALLVGLAYWPTLLWLAGRWRTDPFYSHGPLVPLVSAFLLWTGRRGLHLDPQGSLPGLLVLGAAAGLHLLGVRLMFEFLSCLSLVLTLGGAALLAGGRPLLRAAAFPLLYLVLAIPLPVVILQKVSLPLQLAGSACSAALLQGLGCPASRHGVLLSFPEFTLAVADACSGLRSLITVLAISALAARLAPAPLPRKLLLVALGLIAALAANVLRISLSGLVGMAFGGETAAVFFEHYSGYLFYLLVILALLAAFGLLCGKRGDLPPSPAAPQAGTAIPGRLAFRVLLPLLAVLGPTTAAAIALRSGRAPEAPSRLADWHPSPPGWRVRDAARSTAFPGEELLRGVLEEPGGRTVGFTLLHSMGGRYLHSPEACSLAAGWIPERQEVRDLQDRDGAPFPVSSWVMRRGNDRVWLVFWFNLGRTPARGTLGQHLGALGQRLRTGRIDSAYGEISLPLRIGEELPPEDLVLDLSRSLQREVRGRLWPEP